MQCKLNKKFQYDHVDITAIASTLDVTIAMLRRQYLGLHFGQTSKHLGKFLCEVVKNRMTYADSFGVEYWISIGLEIRLHKHIDIHKGI